MLNEADFALRALRAQDAAMLLRWRNSARVLSMMFSEHQIAPAEHEAWFARALAAPDSRYYVLEYLGRSIGSLNVTQIDWARRSCFVGYYIGEPDAPKGSGTIFGRLMLREIFEAARTERNIRPSLRL